MSDEVFTYLKALNLPTDETNEFTGVPLPDKIVLDVPDAVPLL